MSWDKNLPLEPVFALDTLRNRVNTILKSNQKRNNTQKGDHQIFLYAPIFHMLLSYLNPAIAHLDCISPVF